MNNLNSTESNRLSGLLAAYIATVTADRIRLEEIIQILGNRSIGGVLLVFALPIALPVPTLGISAIFGVPLIFISAQLILRRQHVWLPAKLACKTISRSQLTSIIEHTIPVLRRFEHILKPRAEWLCGTWTYVPVGIVCVVLALIIVLPIPLGHVVPGLAISLFALGLVEHDGWAIALGLVASVIAVIIILSAILGIHNMA